MKRFFHLVIAILCSSLLASGEGVPSIRIEQFKGKISINIERIQQTTLPLESKDATNGNDSSPDSSGCSFYLAPPNGEAHEADTIIFVPSRSDAVISVLINGNFEKFNWSPNQIQNKSHADYSGAWSNGKIIIEVHCVHIGSSDKYYKGIIDVRVGKTRRKFRVEGFCGC